MVLDKEKVYRSLKKKGFEDAINRSKDHKYLDFFYKGKLILFTKVSHGSKKDIGDNLINKMAKQCKLSKQDFLNLINCPLSKEAYIQKLKKLEENN